MNVNVNTINMLIVFVSLFVDLVIFLMSLLVVMFVTSSHFFISSFVYPASMPAFSSVP